MKRFLPIIFAGLLAVTLSACSTVNNPSSSTTTPTTENPATTPATPAPTADTYVLSGLTISTGTLSPAYSSATTAYSASVDYSVTSVTVTPTATGSGGIITVNGTAVTSGNASGAISLGVGTNAITVKVTPTGGSATTYTISVTRQADTATPASPDYVLSGITVSSCTLTPAFDSSVLSYTASVSNSITGVTVTPTAIGSGGTITVNGSTVASGSTSSSVALSVGDNSITIVVTKADNTTKTYTITVTRAAAVYTISSIALSSGTLSPTFAVGTTSYAASVGNSTGSITVTPTAVGDGGTITVNGSAVTSGNSSSVNLDVGSNTVTVIITPTGGSATTYTITVTRAAASGSVNTTMPSSTVNLVFIHHSSGRNWLRTSSATGDFPGALAQALNNNNYYVTDTDYGWDAQAGDNLGDGTDTVNWPSWFVDAKMPYVYANTSVAYYGDSSYSNSIARASGDNEVVIFKSCYPNSEVGGSIADEQAIYNGLLTYFAAHTDKLFILVIPPAPVSTSSYVLTKQLNDWLVDTTSGWLSGYAHDNVGVYDYYCTLSETDSHHTVEAGSVVHSYSASYDGNSPYHTGGDSHPSTAGNVKATTEFLPLLNYYYNTWKGN